VGKFVKYQKAPQGALIPDDKLFSASHFHFSYFPKIARVLRLLWPVITYDSDAIGQKLKKIQAIVRI